MTSCPRCGFDAAPEQLDCPACGIVFARYEAAQQAAAEAAAELESHAWTPAEHTEAKMLQDVPRPLRWLATLNTAGGTINVALAAVLGYALGPEPVVVLNAAVGALYLWIGWAVRRRRPPVRPVLLLASFVGLLAFPVGTITCSVLLPYMLQPGMRVLFSDKHPEELTGVELEQLRALHMSRSGLWFVRVTACLLILTFAGVVGVIGYGGVLAYRHEQRKAQAQNDLRTIDGAVRNFSVGRDVYPGSARAPVLARAMGMSIPLADPWDNVYYYERLKGTSFRVGSPGPDGRWERRRLADYPPGEPCGDDLIVERGKLLD